MMVIGLIVILTVRLIRVLIGLMIVLIIVKVILWSRLMHRLLRFLGRIVDCLGRTPTLRWSCWLIMRLVHILLVNDRIGMIFG